MGVNNSVWADHTDVRPTIMGLLGLQDDYSHDGRVLFEVLTPGALPPVVRANFDFFVRLAQVYKQINAPVGQLGLKTLQISTQALESNSANDATYTQLENTLQTITNQRNAIAGQIIALLESVEFGQHGHFAQHFAMPSTTLLDQAQALIQD